MSEHSQHSQHSQQLTLDDIIYINEKLSRLPFDGSLIDKFNKLYRLHSGDIRLLYKFGDKVICDDALITYYHIKCPFENEYAITTGGVGYNDKGYNYFKPSSPEQKERHLKNGWKEDGDFIYVPWEDKDKVEFGVERVPFNLNIFIELLDGPVYKFIKWDGIEDAEGGHRYCRFGQDDVEFRLPLREGYELCENDKHCIKGMHDFMNELRRLRANNYRAYIEENYR